MTIESNAYSILLFVQFGRSNKARSSRGCCVIINVSVQYATYGSASAEPDYFAVGRLLARVV